MRLIDMSTTSSGDGDFRVAIVCMPFTSARFPSIQVGLMTAIARKAGYQADSHHFNLELASEMGVERYELFCEHRGRMTGEWLFSRVAFGAQAPAGAFLDAFPEIGRWATEVVGVGPGYLHHLRDELLPAYIERCAASVDWGQYRVVGFTSTFQQHVASLALARAIKARHPAVVTVFGGANMDGTMGIAHVRAFPEIDYGIIGEGDVAFPELLARIAGGRPAPGIQGVATRANLDAAKPAAPVRDLDTLPTPSYEEFYRRAAELGIGVHGAAPIETSRGCWWGQKHQCTFCGLNGLGIGYRSKDPARVLSELGELSARHRITAFDATDNILDPKYLNTLFEMVDSAGLDYTFFFEVKANLTPAQVERLYRGGVRRIQPGIESMSTRILKLMRKGCTMLQNVRLLKWCAYYGIKVNWNLIHGFPGESEADYAAELEVLRALSHLQPPDGVSRIWLERFSPYFTDRSAFPVRDVAPEPSYAFVYPDALDLEDAAYFFDYEMGDTVAPSVHRATADWVAEWKQRYASDRPDRLTYRRTASAILIDDARGRAAPVPYTFAGALGVLYEECCGTPRTVPQLMTALQAKRARAYTEGEVAGALGEFCAAKLMVAEDGRYLAVALPANPAWPTTARAAGRALSPQPTEHAAPEMRAGATITSINISPRRPQ
jgi:ribosomal peptide maturation radical SAM protein 1